MFKQPIQYFNINQSLNFQLIIVMGSHRSAPQTKKETIDKQTDALTYAVSHMCGWRIYMQDAHISVAPFGKLKGLFGVFDGHGGAEVAVFVERHFQKQLEKNENFKAQKYKLALEQTFLKMDQLIVTPQGKKQIVHIQSEMKQKENGSKLDEQSHAGCTANVVLITDSQVFIANAGDSRSVASIKGVCRPLSFDHKPEEKKELDRIQAAGGSVSWGRVNGNLNLSRAMGDLEYKGNNKLKPQQQMITAFPDVEIIENKDIDFIIMGCDGIWETKSNEDMVKWVQKRLSEKGRRLGTIVEELLDELVAKDNGGEYGMDNMSSILIQFKK